MTKIGETVFIFYDVFKECGDFNTIIENLEAFDEEEVKILKGLKKKEPAYLETHINWKRTEILEEIRLWKEEEKFWKWVLYHNPDGKWDEKAKEKLISVCYNFEKLAEKLKKLEK